MKKSDTWRRICEWKSRARNQNRMLFVMVMASVATKTSSFLPPAPSKAGANKLLSLAALREFHDKNNMGVGCTDESSRRDFFGNTLQFLKFSTASSLLWRGINVAPSLAGEAGASLEESELTAYAVKPDPSASLMPSLDRVNEKNLLESLSTNQGGGALWLGEHHNSASDHTLQADLIRSIYDIRTNTGQKIPHSRTNPTMALGLEQVQVQFQPILDDFIYGRLDLKQFRKGVEWDTRWAWPFEVYEPLFTLAKELKIPLVALNVNSEDLEQVELYGMGGLSPGKLMKYVQDRQGFAEFTQRESYRVYVSYVIEPSYELHKQLGLLKRTMSGKPLAPGTQDGIMSFRNFLSGRILWDEGMAKAAFQWNKQHPEGLLVGLVGADHVKFVSGIPGRYSGMIDRYNDEQEQLGGSGRALSCKTAMLNPTLIDTRPSGSMTSTPGSDLADRPNEITLQLRYLKDGMDRQNTPVDVLKSPQSTGGVLPLSDYIILSS